MLAFKRPVLLLCEQMIPPAARWLLTRIADCDWQHSTQAIVDATAEVSLFQVLANHARCYFPFRDKPPQQLHCTSPFVCLSLRGVIARAWGRSVLHQRRADFDARSIGFFILACSGRLGIQCPCGSEVFSTILQDSRVATSRCGSVHMTWISSDERD